MPTTPRSTSELTWLAKLTPTGVIEPLLGFTSVTFPSLPRLRMSPFGKYTKLVRFVLFVAMGWPKLKPETRTWGVCSADAGGAAGSTTTGRATAATATARRRRERTARAQSCRPTGIGPERRDGRVGGHEASDPFRRAASPRRRSAWSQSRPVPPADVTEMHRNGGKTVTSAVTGR